MSKIFSKLLGKHSKSRKNLCVACDMDNLEENPRLLTTKDVVEENKRRLQELAAEEFEFRQKAAKYLTVPPDEYFKVLNELYFQRRKAQIEQQKLRTEYEQRKLISENDKLASSSKPKVVIQAQKGWRATLRCLKSLGSKKVQKYLGLRLLRTCGFFTESFVSICYHVVCSTLTLFSLIGMFWNYFECVELHVVFPKDKSIRNIRYLGLGGLASLFVASCFGRAAETLKQAGPFGFLFWLVGWSLFAASMYFEFQLAYGEELEIKMNVEVQNYVNNPGANLRPFMSDVQEGFECCGTYGPEGYGYRRNMLKSDENFTFPLSCCRVGSYRFRLLEQKECVLSGKYENSPFVSNSNAFMSMDGCHAHLQMYFQDLHQVKFLIHWVAILVFVLSILVFICLAKIWIRRRSIKYQYPFLKPHQSRRLSNIDEVITHLNLTASVSGMDNRAEFSEN